MTNHRKTWLPSDTEMVLDILLLNLGFLEPIHFQWPGDDHRHSINEDGRRILKTLLSFLSLILIVEDLWVAIFSAAKGNPGESKKALNNAFFRLLTPLVGVVGIALLPIKILSQSVSWVYCFCRVQWSLKSIEKANNHLLTDQEKAGLKSVSLCELVRRVQSELKSLESVVAEQLNPASEIPLKPLTAFSPGSKSSSLLESLLNELTLSEDIYHQVYEFRTEQLLQNSSSTQGRTQVTQLLSQLLTKYDSSNENEKAQLRGKLQDKIKSSATHYRKFKQEFYDFARQVIHRADEIRLQQKEMIAFCTQLKEAAIVCWKQGSREAPSSSKKSPGELFCHHYKSLIQQLVKKGIVEPLGKDQKIFPTVTGVSAPVLHQDTPSPKPE